MVERPELEHRVKRLVSADILYRMIKSLGERGVRRLDKRASEIVQLLGREEENERFFARIETSSERKARGMEEGIEIFKNEYPRHGKILHELIEEERLRKNKHLVYGIRIGYHLSEEDYLRVMMDLKISRREASALYPHILDLSRRLSKTKANEHAKREILIG